MPPGMGGGDDEGGEQLDDFPEGMGIEDRIDKRFNWLKGTEWNKIYVSAGQHIPTAFSALTFQCWKICGRYLLLSAAHAWQQLS